MTMTNLPLRQNWNGINFSMVFGTVISWTVVVISLQVCHHYVTAMVQSTCQRSQVALPLCHGGMNAIYLFGAKRLANAFSLLFSLTQFSILLLVLKSTHHSTPRRPRPFLSVAIYIIWWNIRGEAMSLRSVAALRWLLQTKLSCLLRLCGSAGWGVQQKQPIFTMKCSHFFPISGQKALLKTGPQSTLWLGTMDEPLTPPKKVYETK